MKDDITCLRCTERMQCRRYTEWLEDIGNFHAPRVNGWSYGSICRIDAEDILAALEYGNMVCYNSDNGKFYEKVMYTHPADYMDDDWECIE